MTHEQPILWYFADPMCSWCWGFAPVIDEIKRHYGGKFKVALMLGGLRPGVTTPLDAALRDEILHHWREVQRRTGQPFKFEGALPDGFVYDTEPPSRAVVTVGELNPAATFSYFKSIQHAFYVEQFDVTHPEVLAVLATPFGVAIPTFTEVFESELAREKTRAQFRKTRELGIYGFPTVVLQRGDDFEIITHGYRPFEEIQPLLDDLLA
jgi:putative protein-disulfide isomerase